ncbi:hypothetical protein BT96DRAFT_1021083 [Gymnopus androsaceus JB14]|uniref:DUF7770 domain-containing protein n=1 Tax=Gymnopus androsaceus JB14 TaxID=1447944 RepID=A0A6A4HG55_9AGAR|nr:hypothetical protein BT96DRAFT_1021083 [Gymnopus androsaceus JB14]
MAFTRSFQFSTLFAITGKTPDDKLSKSDIETVISHLPATIDRIRLVIRERNSRWAKRKFQPANHAVLYLILSIGTRIRFSMEIDEQSPKGTASPGVLVVNSETPSSESLIPVDCLWNREKPVKIFADFIKMLEMLNAQKYIMTEDRQGCRAWQGLCSCLIEAGFFNLSIDNSVLKWTPFSTAPNLSAYRLEDELARKSQARLHQFVRSYFSQKNKKPVFKELSVGVFPEGLPTGKSLLASCQKRIQEEVVANIH